MLSIIYSSRDILVCCLAIMTMFVTEVMTHARGIKPNLILILADDLGYGDLGCYGNDEAATPVLDEMAGNGIRFTRFYAASAVCSPTRASILTGRYPLSMGLQTYFSDIQEGLPNDLMTLPSVLRSAGYETAHVGKWHLGGNYIGQCDLSNNGIPGPDDLGFSDYLVMDAHYEIGVGHMALTKARQVYRHGSQFLIRNGEAANFKEGSHWTDVKIEETIRLIREYTDQGSPYFINLWFDVPHIPYEPPPTKFLEMHEGIHQGEALLYNAMITQMDEGIGRIIRILDELQIRDNTIIVFLSDNGPTGPGLSGNLRGGKGTLYEGGIRVPAIMQWPSLLPEDKVYSGFIHTNDLMPTLLTALNVNNADLSSIHGVDRWRSIEALKPPDDSNEAVFWQMDAMPAFQAVHQLSHPYSTEIVREGPWKLHLHNAKPLALYDLMNDPTESHNLLGSNPGMVKRMTHALHQWLIESVYDPVFRYQ